MEYEREIDPLAHFQEVTDLVLVTLPLFPSRGHVSSRAASKSNDEM